MSLFVAYAGLIIFGVAAVALAAILKITNEDGEYAKQIALREEAARDRTNDYQRHRGQRQ